LAAETAASTSAWLPWATRARTAFVAGLIVSKYCPSVGGAQRPLMKCPKRPDSCCLIHSSAGASLSGAEGGCQAETGAAAGMAAGAATEMLGGTPSQVGHAVALTMQGTLGLVCDPLGGLVELPCVFRNATGSAIALAGIEMALSGITFAIPVDEVIDVMGEIGREMDVRYRETAGGGLAATPTGRRLAKERLYQIKRADG